MRYYTRIGMLSLQYKPLWAIHHVFPILCQISEHLQDALLIKLLDQFFEVHKSQLFSTQRLENLIWDSFTLITLFFLQHLEKLGIKWMNILVLLLVFIWPFTSWIQIPFSPTFYSYFNDNNNPSVVNTICIRSFHYTHMITSRKLQLK